MTAIDWVVQVWHQLPAGWAATLTFLAGGVGGWVGHALTDFLSHRYRVRELAEAAQHDRDKQEQLHQQTLVLREKDRVEADRKKEEERAEAKAEAERVAQHEREKQEQLHQHALALREKDQADAERKQQQAKAEPRTYMDLLEKAVAQGKLIYGAALNETVAFRLLEKVIERASRVNLLPYEASGKDQQVAAHITILVYTYFADVIDKAGGAKDVAEIRPIVDWIVEACRQICDEVRTTIKDGILTPGEIYGLELATRAWFSPDFIVPKTMWAAMNKNSRASPEVAKFVAAYGEKDFERLGMLIVKMNLIEAVTGKPLPDIGFDWAEKWKEAKAQVAADRAAKAAAEKMKATEANGDVVTAEVVATATVAADVPIDQPAEVVAADDLGDAPTHVQTPDAPQIASDGA